jgi:hypothetical protein
MVVFGWQDLCGVHLTQQSKESLQTLMGTEINSKLLSGAQPYTGKHPPARTAHARHAHASPHTHPDAEQFRR